MVAVFREVRRVLRDDGTLWLNMGDSYGGGATTRFQAKQLVGMPWRLALALQADGWYLRSDIIWAKPNPMPESVSDRPTKSHEHVFLLTKQARYFYDAHAVREKGSYGRCSTFRAPKYESGHAFNNSAMAPTLTCTPDSGGGRNLRDVWTIPTEGYAKAHFATFPRKLVVPCLKAGTSAKGCCPECGAPWVRVIESERKATRPGRDNVIDETGMAYRNPRRHVTEYGTVGWKPGCGCSAREYDEDTGDAVRYAPVPCVVADIFMGSGTVGVVAKQMGLSFIGIELNPEYCEMARKRIDNPEPETAIPDVPGQTTFEGFDNELHPSRA